MPKPILETIRCFGCLLLVAAIICLIVYFTARYITAPIAWTAGGLVAITVIAAFSLIKIEEAKVRAAILEVFGDSDHPIPKAVHCGSHGQPVFFLSFQDAAAAESAVKSGRIERLTSKLPAIYEKYGSKTHPYDPNHTIIVGVHQPGSKFPQPLKPGMAE